MPPISAADIINVIPRSKAPSSARIKSGRSASGSAATPSRTRPDIPVPGGTRARCSPCAPAAIRNTCNVPPDKRATAHHDSDNSISEPRRHTSFECSVHRPDSRTACGNTHAPNIGRHSVAPLAGAAAVLRRSARQPERIRNSPPAHATAGRRRRSTGWPAYPRHVRTVTRAALERFFLSPARAATRHCGTVSMNGWRCASFAKCLSRFGWRSRQLISGIRNSR
ncbi:hypothetical protein BTI_713 [Burkholderia thailandensis MSMB121]|nr:hypothetical protein BTI_713 [Burkholderia thailandensis MSMB121]